MSAVDTTLWYTRCPMPTASSVAIADGWLDREFGPDGIAVRSLADVPDPVERLSHYGHAHPALFREGGVVPPLWARQRGAATRLLAVGVECGLRGLLVGPESGIEEPSQLRGRRVAVPVRRDAPIDFGRAVSGRGIAECLGVAGLRADEVSLVEVTSAASNLDTAPRSANGSVYSAWDNVRAASAEVLALVRGEVDAIFVTGGLGLELAALTAGRIVVELTGRDPWGPFSPNHIRVLTVSAGLLDRAPELVVRYVATLQRAAQWAADHEAAALRVVAAEMGVAEEWAHLGLHPATPAHLSLGLSDGLLDRLEAWGAYLYDRRVVDLPVDLAAWLAHEPIVMADAQMEGSPVPRPVAVR